jgi:hypothetical protein
VNFELKVLDFINNEPIHICLNDRKFLETDLILRCRSNALPHLKPSSAQRFTYGNNTGCSFYLIAKYARCTNRFRLST